MKVRLTCPSCGDVTTTSERVGCVDFGGRFSFSARCPVCDRLVIKDCDLSTYSRLVAYGAAWTDEWLARPIRSYLNHPANGGPT